MRIGGRLRTADLSNDGKHSYILPRRHHVSTLLVHHYHEVVAHQGRQFTEGRISSVGWIMDHWWTEISLNCDSCV